MTPHYLQHLFSLFFFWQMAFVSLLIEGDTPNRVGPEGEQNLLPRKFGIRSI